MPVFRGEMSRHLNKCYPAGKAQDKKPVPNELSMLIFYLNTRPAKLPKCARTLQTRAIKYSNSDNGGNFSVTALIMHEIISKLHEHFNLFAESALEIIELLIIKSRGSDVQYLSLAKALFGEYNRYHSGVLFAGHPSYSSRFLKVIDSLSDIAISGPPQPRLLAIKALGTLAESSALGTPTGQKGLNIAVKGIQANIPRSSDNYSRYNSALVDSISVNGEAVSNGEPNDSKAMEESVGSEAVNAIRRFLDTSSMDQIVSITKNLLKWLGANSGSWQPGLIATLAKWVPPQNRFVVTKTVVNALAQLPVDDIKLATTYSIYLDALLTAEESKIGLSVVDVLSKLARLQHRLIETPPPSADNQSIQDLIMRLRHNIGNLNNARIYPDQSSDMVSELLQKFGSQSHTFSSHPSAPTPSSKPKTPSDAEKSENLNGYSKRPVGVLINDLHDLLEILSSPGIHDQRKLNTSMWEDTVWVLSSTNSQLLVSYVKTFTKFLEYAQIPAHPSTKRGSLIVRQICQLLQQKLSAANYIACYYVLVAYIHFQGESSVYHLPWLFSLISVHDRNSESDILANANIATETLDVEAHCDFQRVSRLSVSLASLLAIFTKLERKDTADTIFKIIEEHVARKLWLAGITYPIIFNIEKSISTVSTGEEITFGDYSKAPFVSFETLHFTPVEEELVRNPPFGLYADLESEDLSGVKVRNGSVSHYNGTIRNVSGQSALTNYAESSLPRINDLRRRQTDIQNLRSVKAPVTASPQKDHHIGLPTKRDSVTGIKPSDSDLLSILHAANFSGFSKDGHPSVQE